MHLGNFRDGSRLKMSGHLLVPTSLGHPLVAATGPFPCVSRAI